MARTTLVIPDTIWRELKLRAAKDNKNISDWVAEAIQMKLRPAGKPPAPNAKFEESWIAKDMGDFKIPLSREAMSDLPD